MVHTSVEIPFFIFPVILLLVGNDLFDTIGGFGWLGLGSLGTLGLLAAGLPSPIFGSLSDRFPRGVMMSLSLIISAIGSLLIGFWGTSFFVVALGILIMGLGVSLYHPPGLTWVSAAFSDAEGRSSSNFNQVLAFHSVGGTVGSSLGPISVYFLLGSFTWRQIYLLWSIPILLLAFIFWIFIGRYESPIFPKTLNFIHTPKNNSKESNLNKNLTALIIIFSFVFLMSLTRGMIGFILSPFLIEEKKFKTTGAALFVGLSLLLGATGQIFAGIAGDRYSEKRVLVIAAFLQVFVLSGIFIVSNLVFLFTFYLSFALINSTFWPITNSIIGKTAIKRGKAFGWFQMIANVVGAIGPIIDGVLIGFDPNRYLMIFVCAIIFSILAFLILGFLSQESREN